MFSAVFHQVEDGDGGQVSQEHEHLPPLDRPAHSLTTLENLRLNQKLGTITLEKQFSTFPTSHRGQQAFGRPPEVVEVVAGEQRG